MPASPLLRCSTVSPPPHPVRGLEFYKESMAAGESLSNYYAAVEQIDEVRVGPSARPPALCTPRLGCTPHVHHCLPVLLCRSSAP